MISYEQFKQQKNGLNWSERETLKNYEIALKVEKRYYEMYGTSKEPKIGDIVEFTDGWRVYKHAKIVENMYFDDDDKVCICENGSSFTNGHYFSTSGGAFHSMDKSLLQYAGEDENIVWTWNCYGPGANHGLYFPIKVNKWIIPYDPKTVKRSTVYFKQEGISIQNSTSCMTYAMSFNSLKAFKAWAEYVGYEYHMTEDGEKAYSHQEINQRCWTSDANKPTTGKPIKVLGNAHIHDGLVVTEEFCITEWWPNIQQLICLNPYLDDTIHLQN